MRKILIVAALIVSSPPSGCNQLARYMVSEREVNRALQKRNHFAKDIGLRGVADAHIKLQNLTSAIGREEPGKVTLAGVANVDLNPPFDTQGATIDLKPKALPTFDREEGVVFLQGMEVIDAKVTPEKLQLVIQALPPYLSQSLRSYFSQQPICVLCGDASTGRALAKKHTKGIGVRPGGIVIPFTN